MTLVAGRRGSLFAEFELGRAKITAMSDGYADLPWERIAGKTGRGTFRLQVLAFFVETPDANVLIDSGTANAWHPTMGRLYDAMAEAGIPRESVSKIAITHCHIDHINGLVTPGGDVAFPSAARILIPRNEAQLFAEEVRLKPVAGRVALFDDGDEIIPGLRAMAAYGHEVGHSAFLLESGGERLLFWGDTIHVPSVQFADPTLTWQFDTDQDMARQTRLRLFDFALEQRCWVAGAHHDFPGVGRIARDMKGFRYLNQVAPPEIANG